jgi:hypothetical protein
MNYLFADYTQPSETGFGSPSVRALAKCMALVLVLSASAAAQVAPLTVDPNAILGFESLAGWSSTGNTATAPSETSTTIRTQGNFALAVKTPSNLTKVTSMPVLSTAVALAGVGNTGAMFEVDLMLPTQQGNQTNSGQLQLLVNCPSRGISNVNIGAVTFNTFRLGIYNTMKFPVPAPIGAALGASQFSDLTFQFLISSPGTGQGTYIFDNLRVHSVALVTANAGTVPPPGYGGSVDLVATDSTPGQQTFDAAPVQVPKGFHLKLGTTGGTSAKLDLGYVAGTPAITCTYNGDSADSTHKSYTLLSCTGGVQAGDLVGASWARLAIQFGSPTMKIRAQLAKSPVGDQTGGGIIPPMPTYWGDWESCIPAPLTATCVSRNASGVCVATVSDSCAAQRAEGNQIVTDYFNLVKNSSVAPNWIVTPKPEAARRHSNGAAFDTTNGAPPPPHDPPFHQESHLNPGGDFDAYWRLDGSFTPTNYPGTDRNTADFDATFSTHAVLFGGDVDILNVHTTAHTDTGETQPTFVAPNSNGSLHLMLFGIEVPPGGFSGNAGGGFQVPPVGSPALEISQDYNLPPIPIWIFTITIGATTSVGVSANVGWGISGLDVQVTPHGSVGAHLEGSIDLGIASGGVDARLDLLEVSTPVTAQASWFLNPAPTSCAVTTSASLNGKATIGAGGGEIDLVASIGICPFCDDVSFTLVSWDPLVSYTQQLFDIQLAASAFELPVVLCTAPLNVSITTPAPGATLRASTPYTFTGQASGNGGNVPCDKLIWTLSTGGAFVPPAANTGCSVRATFSQEGPATINLSASVTYTDAFNNPITESNDATPVSVTVTPLPPGVYIQQIQLPTSGPDLGSGGKIYTFCTDFCTDTLTIQPDPAGVYTLTGLIVGDTQPTSTTWTVTGPATQSGPGPTTTILSSDPSTFSFPYSLALWTPTGNGTYTITMTTTPTPAGVASGSTTVTVTLSPIN